MERGLVIPGKENGRLFEGHGVRKGRSVDWPRTDRRRRRDDRLLEKNETAIFKTGGGSRKPMLRRARKSMRVRSLEPKKFCRKNEETNFSRIEHANRELRKKIRSREEIIYPPWEVDERPQE